MVDSLKSHAPGKTAITDNGDHLMVFLQMIACHCHSDSQRNRRRAVSGYKSIVFAFDRIDKSTQSFVLAKSVKAVTAPGQHFVNIGLMTDIPENLVGRAVKDIVQT